MLRHRPHQLALFATTLTICAFGALYGCRSLAPTEPQPPSFHRRPPQPLPRPLRAAWVARFHYRYPDDIATIMANCAAAGCNTVFWQVRGDGTAMYPSRLEPWGRAFGFEDPGFDPLALAVQEAHRHGLRIEAWVNVMPGWQGRTPPPHGGQLYHTHPDWFLHDAAGRPQPLGDFYVILNPCLPEVRRHIVAVFDDLVSRYDLDGVHLDYVRYAWEGLAGARQAYPRDAGTLALYRRETGRHPDDDAAAWDHWRANQLTRLVDDIGRVVRRRRPGISVTASVWRDPRIGYRDYLQNSVAWLRAGLVDVLVPMVYTADAGQFAADIDSYRRLVGRGWIVPGIGLYMHERPEQVRAQLQYCAEWGGDYALFSYDSLYPTHGDRDRDARERAAGQALRDVRRAVLGEFAR